MSTTQVPEKISRCEERSHPMEQGKRLTPGQETDAAIKGTVERALWKDDVLRAIESNGIDVHVKDGVVHLDGHLASTTSQRRIQNAMRVIPGLAGVQNNLIMDDRLTIEVAAALGALEHTYGCKFFTGASHGVVSLNGIVNHEDVKLLAEKSVSGHPDVRAVINNVRVAGVAQELPDQPFLQPTLGQIIYFRDGISGVVRQVIINPDNRRVIAMILWGEFANQPDELRSTNNAQTGGSAECLVVVPMSLIRYITRISGFLLINSKETEQYVHFDPTHFSSPAEDWKAPYPYCSDDVLFPVNKRKVEYQMLEHIPRSPFVVAWVEQSLSEELLANDSLGG